MWTDWYLLHRGGEVVQVPVSEGQCSTNPLNTDCSVVAFIPLSHAACFPPFPTHTHFDQFLSSFFLSLLCCFVYSGRLGKPTRVWWEQHQSKMKRGDRKRWCCGRSRGQVWKGSSGEVGRTGKEWHRPGAENNHPTVGCQPAPHAWDRGEGVDGL